MADRRQRLETRHGRTWISVAIGLALIFLGAPVAQARSGCVLGCNMVKKECVLTGKTLKLACKLDCRDNAPPEERGACKRVCTDTFRTTKREICRPNHQTCREGCATVDPDDCLMTCGETLAMCARGVVTEGRACVSGCRSDPDRLGCLLGCASDAEAGAALCEGEFTGCVGGCEGGSPSGAFLMDFARP